MIVLYWLLGVVILVLGLYQWAIIISVVLSWLVAFEIVNMRLGFNFDNIDSTLTLWGRNITDERYFHGSFDQPIGLGRMNSYPGEPATYGISFQKNFD